MKFVYRMLLTLLTVTAKSKYEILELHDIEKEFMLVDAKLRLINRDQEGMAFARGRSCGFAC